MIYLGTSLWREYQITAPQQIPKTINTLINYDWKTFEKWLYTQIITKAATGSVLKKKVLKFHNFLNDCFWDYKQPVYKQLTLGK